jgi:L-iditol 2-dehydrogenase
MLVGNPSSDMGLSREIYWKILRNQLTLRGTWNSSFYGIDGKGDDWRYALDRLVAWSKLKTEGKTIMLPHDLITHRFSLKDMNLGLDIMRTKSEEYVKVMVGFS